MVEIINGPGMEIFTKISKRQRIIFELKNHVTQQLTIESIEKTGDDKFNFVTEVGGHGDYDTKKKKGQIDYPPIILLTSETTSEAEV